MPPVRLPHWHGQPVEEFCAAAPSVHDFQTVADVFRQLGDATRMRVFWLLCHGEECVINISALMEMSSPAVSHHLRSLKSAGLIVSRREGKEVYYKAAASETAALLHRAIEELMPMVCPCAQPRRRDGNE